MGRLFLLRLETGVDGGGNGGGGGGDDGGDDAANTVETAGVIACLGLSLISLLVFEMRSRVDWVISVATLPVSISGRSWFGPFKLKRLFCFCFR